MLFGFNVHNKTNKTLGKCMLQQVELQLEQRNLSQYRNYMKLFLEAIREKTEKSRISFTSKMHNNSNPLYLSSLVPLLVSFFLFQNYNLRNVKDDTRTTLSNLRMK